MRYFTERADQADVVSVTFLGGKGHEFLCDGGFQRDGSILAVLWSDRGNSVASLQPNDIRTHGGGRGVG